MSAESRGAEEEVERDSAESERIDDVLLLVAPPTLLARSSSFGMHVNGSALSGWVKQPSPCCGAASVAGALNALLRLHRDDPMAFSHTDILRVYQAMYAKLIMTKVRAFERRLGHPFQSVLTALESELLKDDKIIGGRRTPTPSKSAVKKAVLRIFADESVVVDAAWRTLRDTGLMSSHVVNDKTEEVDCLMQSLSVPFRSSFRMEDAEGEGDEGSEEEQPGGAELTWNWALDLQKIIKSVSGFRKLSDEGCPSTAPIGNLGVMEAVQNLTEAANIAPAIEIRLFMGARRGTKSKLAIAVSHSDDAAAISQQWDVFRTAMASANSVLLFHLRNHYALVFALREYTAAEGGNITREILTARKGQRPTVWINFEEMREIVLGWDGYKVMRLSLSSSANLSESRDCKAGIPSDADLGLSAAYMGIGRNKS